jgi:hypothetical protein
MPHESVQPRLLTRLKNRVLCQKQQQRLHQQGSRDQPRSLQHLHPRRPPHLRLRRPLLWLWQDPTLAISFHHPGFVVSSVQ